MLPAERNQRWAWRVGLAVVIVLFVYIVVWVFRFIGGVWHQALEQRDVPIEEGAAAIVEIV